jgi:hypothetical protein
LEFPLTRLDAYVALIKAGYPEENLKSYRRYIYPLDEANYFPYLEMSIYSPEQK